MESKLKTVFRYPGGKNKKALSQPVVERVLSVGFKQINFVDVFTGGGAISIAVANEFINKKAISVNFVLNDIDEHISSFWKIICRQDQTYCKLMDLIKRYGCPTTNVFREIKEWQNLDYVQLGFRGLFLNRTAFSGILSSGPIGGYDQAGNYKIDCRYDAEVMSQRIESLHNYFSKNSFCYKRDFKKIIKEYSNKENVILYLDPPYMKQGKALYQYWMEENDYVEMKNLLLKSHCKWIISHDDNEDFLKLFSGINDVKISYIENIAYTINSIKDKKRKELIISNIG